MTPFRSFSSLNPVRTLRRGSLYLAMAAALAAAGCGSNEPQWESVEVQEPTKGVVSIVREKADGSYEVVSEQIVESKDSSRVIIERADGTTQELTLDMARTLVTAQDTVAHKQPGSHGSHGMGGLLWYSAMGYMMGRNMSQPVNPGVYAGGSANSAAPRTGGNLKYVPTTSSQGDAIRNNLSGTARTTSYQRPVSGGRTGFFGRSSRSGGVS
jgi:hypothetical protein